jgi:hypothetical protein
LHLLLLLPSLLGRPRLVAQGFSLGSPWHLRPQQKRALALGYALLSRPQSPYRLLRIPLPEAIASGAEPFLIMGAIAGG